MKRVFPAFWVILALSLCSLAGCAVRTPEPKPAPAPTPAVTASAATAAPPLSPTLAPTAQPVLPVTPSPTSVVKTGAFTPDGLRLTSSFAPQGLELAEAQLMSDGTYARTSTTASGLTIREERRLPGHVSDQEIVSALQADADEPHGIGVRACPGLSARLTYPVWLAEYKTDGAEGARAHLAAFVGTDDWTLVYTLVYPAGSEECALLADRWIALICLQEPQDEPDPVLEAPIDDELRAMLDSAANAAVDTRTSMFVKGEQPDAFAVAYVHGLMTSWLPDHADIPVAKQSVALRADELERLFARCFDEGRMPPESAWTAREGISWADGVVTFAADLAGAARFAPEMSRYTPEGDVWVHGSIMLGDKSLGKGSFLFRPTGAPATPLLYRLSSMELD